MKTSDQPIWHRAMKCRTHQASGAARANNSAGTQSMLPSTRTNRTSRLPGERGLPREQQRDRPLHREQDAESAMRAHGELRHDFVTQFTGTSLALR